MFELGPGAGDAAVGVAIGGAKEGGNITRTLRVSKAAAGGGDLTLAIEGGGPVGDEGEGRGIVVAEVGAVTDLCSRVGDDGAGGFRASLLTIVDVGGTLAWRAVDESLCIPLLRSARAQYEEEQYCPPCK